MPSWHPQFLPPSSLNCFQDYHHNLKYCIMYQRRKSNEQVCIIWSHKYQLQGPCFVHIHTRTFTQPQAIVLLLTYVLLWSEWRLSIHIQRQPTPRCSGIATHKGIKLDQFIYSDLHTIHSHTQHSEDHAAYFREVQIPC